MALVALAAASAEDLRDSKVVAAEADFAVATAAVVEVVDSGAAATNTDEATEMDTELRAVHHLALDSIDETATAEMTGAHLVVVGMIPAVAVAHMMTDMAVAAAATEMAVDMATVKADVPAATWNPLAVEKVGFGTETSIDPGTTTVAENVDMMAAATRIPGNCAVIKLRSLLLWPARGFSILPWSLSFPSASRVST